jgi:ATP-dependent DNA helicase RecQ
MPESFPLQDDSTDSETDYDTDIEIDLCDIEDAPLRAMSIGDGIASAPDFTYDPSDSRYIQVQERMGIPQIRETQARVLSLLCAGKSVLLLARTGWGKSLIFQGLLHMMPVDSRRYITVVFVPLSGLGQEQVAELNERGRKLGATTDEAIFYDKTKLAAHHLDDIEEGRYKWVFLSPEKALHQDVFRKLWENSDFRGKVLLLAVDEAHLVSEWYV